MAVYVALWDCPSCGNKGNMGPLTHCAGCGSSRPPDVQFYLPDNPMVVENEEELQKIAAGVDWICGHCQGQNKAWDKVCRSCANPRDEESKDVALKEVEYSLEEVPTTGQVPRKPNENELAHLNVGKTKPYQRNLLFIAAFFLLIGIVYLFTATTSGKVRVDSFEWERVMDLEHNEIVQKEDWSAPPKAFDVKNYQAIHHYNQVLIGYVTRTRTVQVPAGTRRYVCGRTSTGNGYFRDKYCTETIYKDKQESYQDPQYQSVPVYQTKYNYRIYEWVKKEPIKASAKNQQAQWPTSSYLQQVNEWREGNKVAHYWVFIKDNKGLTHKEEVPLSLWQTLKPNAEMDARVRWWNGKYVELESTVGK